MFLIDAYPIEFNELCYDLLRRSVRGDLAVEDAAAFFTELSSTVVSRHGDIFIPRIHSLISQFRLSNHNNITANIPGVVSNLVKSYYLLFQECLQGFPSQLTDLLSILGNNNVLLYLKVLGCNLKILRVIYNATL